MNLNKIKAVIELIKSADVVRIVGAPDVSPDVVDRFTYSDPVGADPNNEVLYFEWDGVGDDYGQTFALKFTEGGIDHCTLHADEGVIKLCDHEGNMTELQLCKTVPMPFNIF